MISGATIATVESTEPGTATVASPAPARSVASPAIPAAPAFPIDPPSTSTRPNCPLAASRGLGTSRRATSSGVTSSSLSADCTASSGDPIWATNNGPLVRSPKMCAGRGAVNVTMTLARE